MSEQVPLLSKDLIVGILWDAVPRSSEALQKRMGQAAGPSRIDANSSSMMPLSHL